ncbi:hypothetical protein BC833DRAFT_566775 [Globomyces pollinis-pini]|nr:hypothetical protein BC833DRAFT_566775 [Globomyces pollinis-pini]
MLIFSLATTNFLVGLQYSAKTKSLNQHYWVNAICKSSGRIPDFYMALLFIPISRNSFITKLFKVHPVESTYHHRNLSISFFISIVIHAGSCLWSTVTTNDLELVERNVDSSSLVLYSLDLIVKIRNYFTNHRVFQCSLEKCGWIRLEARGIQTSFALANGYFFDFTFKELDSRTSRSLRLLQQLKNKQPPQSSNIELETLLDNDHLLISGVIHGPFGNNFFDFNRINQLACIVTGAGLMSSTLMIQEFIIKCPHKPVFLFWAIKDITQVEVSLLNEDLLSIKPNRLRIQLYNHQLPLSRRVQISHVRQRMNAKAIIDHEIIPSMKSSRDIVGIFTSGSSIAYDVEDACARYPERIILKKFLYER